MIGCLAVSLAVFSGCSGDVALTTALDEGAGGSSGALVEPVSDLTVSTSSESSVTLVWSAVGDGTGRSASYRVKYAVPPLDWSSGSIGCDVGGAGARVGEPLSCSVGALDVGTTYDFQLMSYRTARSGTITSAAYSNVATGRTAVASGHTAAPGLALADAVGLAVTESGGADAFTVVLTARPSAAVTLRITSADVGEAAVNPATLTFAPAAWSVPQSVSIRGVDDALVDGDVVTTVTVAVDVGASAVEYAGVGDETVAVTTRDDDTPGLALADTAGLAVTESGGTDAFTVVLTARPSAAVVLVLTSSDVGEAAVSSASLTFAPAAWNVPQSVSVRGVDDVLVDGDVVTTVAVAVDVSASAPEYAIVPDETVPVTTIDDDTPNGPATVPGDMWIDPAALAALPTAGAAWVSVLGEANSACGVVDLADQDQANNVCILAKALVFARTGGTSYRSDVTVAIREIVSSGTYSGRALSLGRELAAYVIAADLIDLAGLDPALDQQFRSKLRELLTTYTSGAASSLVDCHERRPNNWGAMCGASRAAVAVYLGDTAELARTAQVFKGFLGDRSSYAGFTFGELSWQCDPSRPVAINPAGCQRYGHDLDGVIPDDQRRAGPYSSWPPPKENYVWESLQGILAQAVILERAGYPAFDWEDQAILRAVQWLHTQADFPAAGDDTWLPHLVNHFYGTSFPAPVPSQAGKNMGWTDWTHGP